MIEIPDFLIEMSKQMNEQPSSGTAHPFWQVRYKHYIPTECGYNAHHWELSDGEGVAYRSDKQSSVDAANYLRENYHHWFYEKLTDIIDDEFFEDGMTDEENFAACFDYDYEDLPDGVNRVFVQEVEEIASTHLTEHEAKWFIKRKQHDYPPLYTYVASAYWSPQLRELQDWIIGLTNTKEDKL